MQESYTCSDVQLVNVNFSYGKKQILHNLSIDLSFGICGLLGPNGAGKTTLLNVIATIYAPSSGKLFVHGFDVTDRAERAKARSNIGYLPQ
ncbi:ATP-binding cassette domain-containing protein, partial [Gardnerella swidsinskii]|uniref:ATP-binding cassette domain-containing protein n=4 Tax=Bifidobacteriaceae TaxID=31953 RepID=UPI00320D4B14